MIFKRALFLISLILLGCLSTPFALADQIIRDSKGREIHLLIANKEMNLSEDKALLVEVFSGRYRNIPPQKIRPNLNLKTTEDVKGWLGTLFDQEEDAFRRGEIYYVRAFHNSKFIGFVTFEEERSENNAIYVREMAVASGFQDHKLLEELGFSIKRDPNLRPDTRTLFFSTRKETLTKETEAFYLSLGCSLSTYENSRQDKGEYQGFVWRQSTQATETSGQQNLPIQESEQSDDVYDQRYEELNSVERDLLARILSHGNAFGLRLTTRLTTFILTFYSAQAPKWLH